MSYHKSSGTTLMVPLFMLLISVNYFMSCNAQLSTTFYDTTCPTALSTIRTSIRSSVSSNRRNAALVIRLLFHDCFVQGCDASLLLSGAGSERASPANDGVLGYEVIDAAKAAVERVCPGVVSCADILAVAARDASVAVGGPSWTVRLGRRDSTTSNAAQAATDLPRGNMVLSQLISNFANKGLNTREMVALSGSHTLGQARCIRFRGRIYNSTLRIEPNFNRSLSQACPPTGNDATLRPLDLVTPNSFDNNYYRNLVTSRGLLISDQVLFNADSTDSIVTEYVNNPATFAADFAAAMVKMSEIGVVTGTSGIVRTLCGNPS
uniref:Basic peroxidase n=1 Tax=Zinnia elegans TaxID=34245 RepID=PER2_ZINEL|nr:RecName: Full=Basic peroxidase; AltName: Full=ZePrx33.44; AltName: Full=ZePrx34.70; Flags: Precursor [Zinnia elegans]CAI54299.1 putative peroxidase [Zinnia elegans]CAI54301.1 putative peroxidase [Zinnia elegans]